MKKYDIVFSIPVHEKLDVIIDQLINIIHFNPTSAVVLHLSKSLDLKKNSVLKDDFFLTLNNFDNIFVNPKRFATGWGNILHCHISNFQFLEELIDFEYFIPMTSNELFIKFGLFEHIKGHSFGGVFEEVSKRDDWITKKPSLNDDVLKQMLYEISRDFRIYGGTLEGTFYSKELMSKIVKTASDKFSVSEGNSDYTRDEVYIPSLAINICGNASCKKSKFTYMNWNKDLHVGICEINALIENNEIYSVKRVERDNGYYVRCYIRQRIGNYYNLVHTYAKIKKCTRMRFLFCEIGYLLRGCIKKIIFNLHSFILSL